MFEILASDVCIASQQLLQSLLHYNIHTLTKASHETVNHTCCLMSQQYVPVCLVARSQTLNEPSSVVADVLALASLVWSARPWEQA